jgi:hypothetical protein
VPEKEVSRRRYAFASNAERDPIRNNEIRRKKKGIAMSTQYSVTISLDSSTVTALQDGGYQLYGFQGVDAPGDGVPVVWFSTTAFSSTNEIEWEEQYGGYTSTTTNLAPGTQIIASSSAAMNLGQLMTVNTGGIGTVTNNGTPGSLEILNNTNTQFTCGITVLNYVTNVSNPICAFPLYGSGLDEFTPIELAFFMFATTPVNTGTVIEQAFSPGILVDLTGGTTTTAVSYDINNGWTGPGNTTNYPATTSLTQLLINPGGTQAMSVRSARRARQRSRRR